MAAGAKDTNGIWLYGEDDPLSPFADLLNLGQKSVSDAITARASVEPGKCIVAPTSMGTVVAPVAGTEMALTPLAISVLPNLALVRLDFTLSITPSAATQTVVVWTIVATGGLTVLGLTTRRIATIASGLAYNYDVVAMVRSNGSAGTVNLTMHELAGGAASASCSAFGAATLA